MQCTMVLASCCEDAVNRKNSRVQEARQRIIIVRELSEEEHSPSTIGNQSSTDTVTVT